MGRNRAVKIESFTAAVAGVLVCASPSVAIAASVLSLCLANAQIVSPENVWSAWSLAPTVVLPLLILGAAYCWLFTHRREWSESGGYLRAASFAAGYLFLIAAVVSPLCRLAAILTFAHMIQHVILVAVAAPLLVLGVPTTALSKMEVPYRLAVWTGVYGAAIWFWHVPRFYEAALLHESVHLLMYGSLLIVSTGFWRSIVLAGRTSTMSCAGAAVALLLTLLHTGMLGALLTFSRGLWYPLLSRGGDAWGLTAQDDQQLAGLIMWIPMGAVYAVSAIALAGIMLARMERAAPAVGRAPSPGARVP